MISPLITTLPAGGGETDTDCVRVVVPPGPTHSSVYVTFDASGPNDSAPAVDFAPVQPSDAVHPVALLLDHLRVVEWLTVVASGDALRATVGGGMIVTEALAEFDPPAPLHDNVKAVSALSGPTTSLPEVALLPLHPCEALHDSAPVLDHVSVDD